MTAQGHIHSHKVYFDEASYLWIYAKDDCRVIDDPQLKDSNDSIHGQTQDNETVVTKQI